MGGTGRWTNKSIIFRLPGYNTPTQSGFFNAALSFFYLCGNPCLYEQLKSALGKLFFSHRFLSSKEGKNP
jgi:hypothetical protein